MIRPIEKLDTYSYSISDVVLSATDFSEAITIKSIQVNSLTVFNDYNKNVVPSMLLSANVDKSAYEQVVTSMNTLTATFTIFMTKDDPDNLSVYRSPIITGTFKAYNKDQMDTRAIHQLDSVTNDATNTTQDTIELNLYLYDHISLKKYRMNKSYITSCSMNDILYTIVKDRGLSNLLMTSINEPQKMYMLEYGTLGDNLESLNNIYGIYNNPYLFFMDFNTTYLIDSGEAGKTLRSNELSTVNMYLEKVDNTTSITNGCYVDVENGNYILNAYPFSVNDSDSMIDFYAAGKLISVLRAGKEKYESVLGDYDIERVMLIDNKKLHNQAVHRINTSKRSIPMEFSDIDISIISPNKKYNLIPDTYYSDKYYIKGEYSLSNSIFIFARQSNDIMKCSVQCIFNKLK